MWSRLFILLLFLIASPAVAGDVILVFGDSLSAGYGVPQKTGWVTLLERKLADDGSGLQVVNASISGETTVGGKHRIESTLRRHKPKVVVLELGANDGLRGGRIADIQRNLSTIVEVCQKYGAKVLLVGIRVPPNYGRDYAESFYAVFPAVARQHGAALVPFMLDGFADNRSLFQHDGIHPTREAQPLVMENVYKYLKPLL